MPKKRHSPDLKLTEEELQPELPRDEETPRKHRPKIILPLTDDGRIDTDPSRMRDKTAVERARFALGMTEAAAPVEPQKLVPREMVPFLYDGLAAIFRIGVHAFKWPKVMTTEERAEFTSYMQYSAEFKEKATEPTATLLDKVGANSRVMRWLAANQDVGVVLFLIYAGTAEMFQTAGQKFSFEKAKRQAVDEATKGKVNGGFPASENRPIAVG